MYICRAWNITGAALVEVGCRQVVVPFQADQIVK
jgi:hypothetical protein